METEAATEPVGRRVWVVWALVGVALAVALLVLLPHHCDDRTAIKGSHGRFVNLQVLMYGLEEYAACNGGDFPAGLADLEVGGLEAMENFHLADWIYFPGYRVENPPSTILVASADGIERRRLVLTLDGRRLSLDESDFRECVEEQQRNKWSERVAEGYGDHWRFLSSRAWEAWKARPPGEYDTGDVPRFLKALESDDRLERSNAAEVLSEIRPVLPVVVPALLVALGDSDAGYNSAQGLASISLLDGSIVPSLVEILQSAEGKAPYWAVVALEEIGLENDTTAIPAVITALVEEKEGGLRIAAAKAVAGVGPVAVDAVPRLVKIASGEEDSWDCKCAVIALGRIGPQAAAALPLLTRMFDLRHEYRIDVARALWRIDPSQAARLVPELVVELEGELSPGKDGSITNEFLSAVELLGQIGSEAQAAVPVLKENLWGWRRFDVAWALWRIDPGQLDMVMPVFADCLYCFAPPEGDRITRLSEEPWNKYPNERSFKFPFTTRVAAFGALWQIHPDRRGAMAPLLIALLREWGQQKVLKRLEAETRSAIPALEDLIGSEPQRDIGLLAREALRKIKTTDPGRW